jgi:hypothetical protein
MYALYLYPLLVSVFLASTFIHPQDGHAQMQEINPFYLPNPSECNAILEKQKKETQLSEFENRMLPFCIEPPTKGPLVIPKGLNPCVSGDSDCLVYQRPDPLFGNPGVI